MTYKVWVCLECEYDDIEADSEEEAGLSPEDVSQLSKACKEIFHYIEPIKATLEAVRDGRIH